MAQGQQRQCLQLNRLNARYATHDRNHCSVLSGDIYSMLIDSDCSVLLADNYGVIWLRAAM